MQRFFVPSQNISADKIIISDKGHLRHMKGALRLKVNDRVIICDDKGNEYVAEIDKISHYSINLKIKQRPVVAPAQKLQITFACAIPKKSKFDDIIDKLTQLGVDRIIPLKTKRVIIKLDKQKEMARLSRWRKKALSAAEQSQRKNLPAIELPRDIEEVLSDSSDYDLKIIPTLSGKRKTLRELFEKSCYKNILVLIGPEGDFTGQEVDLAKKAGCVPVSLGDLVLRVETAAIAVAAFISLNEPSPS